MLDVTCGSSDSRLFLQEERIEEEKMSPLAVVFLQVPLSGNQTTKHARQVCKFA